MALKDEEIKQIVQGFTEELDKRRSIDEKMHKVHHAYIEDELARRKRRREMWEAVQKQVLGWSIIVALTWLGSVVAQHIFKIGGK